MLERLFQLALQILRVTNVPQELSFLSEEKLIELSLVNQVLVLGTVGLGDVADAHLNPTLPGALSMEVLITLVFCPRALDLEAEGTLRSSSVFTEGTLEGHGVFGDAEV